MLIMAHAETPDFAANSAISTSTTTTTTNSSRAVAQVLAAMRLQQQSRKFPSYGYHNSFHTHAVDQQPPSYKEARMAPLQAHLVQPALSEELPEYECTVYKEAIISFSREFRTPFLEADAQWQERHVILRGPKLWIHRTKAKSLRANPTEELQPGKFVQAYSLQHSEVGIAVDLAPASPMPKHSFIKLLPRHSQQQMLYRKPELFTSARTWMIRLRVEAEQIVLAFDAQAEMLDWVEALCTAIDIATPLEDRSEPRYRSLPRRNRRQRQLEGIEEGSSTTTSTITERLVLQQERIINALYPSLGSQLAQGVLPALDESDENPGHEIDADATGAALQRMQSRDNDGANGSDPDAEDLDPADVTETFDLSRTNTRAGNTASPPSSPGHSEADNTGEGSSSFDPKTSPRPRPLSSNALIRYRRRCAPIMSRNSPRASDILFIDGARFRLDAKRERLLLFEMSPPRYAGEWNEGQKFTKNCLRASTRDELVASCSALDPEVYSRNSRGDTTGGASNRSSTLRRVDQDRFSIHSSVGSSADPSDADAISPALTTTTTRMSQIPGFDNHLSPTITLEPDKQHLFTTKSAGLNSRSRERSAESDDSSRILSVGLAGLVM